MLIDKAEIHRLIPHAGSMCLLDGVTAWDGDSIVCVSTTHRDQANPLRRHGRLSALHAFEYGAQAVAVHGGLLARTAGQQAPFAYLAALRHGRLFVARLDGIEDRLEVTARRLVGDSGNTIYEFRVDGGGQALAQARVTIITRASP